MSTNSIDIIISIWYDLPIFRSGRNEKQEGNRHDVARYPHDGWAADADVHVSVFVMRVDPNVMVFHMFRRPHDAGAFFSVDM